MSVGTLLWSVVCIHVGLASGALPQEWFPGVMFRWDMKTQVPSGEVQVFVSAFNITTGQNLTFTHKLSPTGFLYSQVEVVGTTLAHVQRIYYVALDATSSDGNRYRWILGYNYDTATLTPQLLTSCRRKADAPPTCMFVDAHGVLNSVGLAEGALYPQWYSLQTTGACGKIEIATLLKPVHDHTNCVVTPRKAGNDSLALFYISVDGDIILVQLDDKKMYALSPADSDQLNLTYAGALQMFAQPNTMELYLAQYDRRMFVKFLYPEDGSSVQWVYGKPWPRAGEDPQLDYQRLVYPDTPLQARDLVLYFTDNELVIRGWDFYGAGSSFIINQGGLGPVCAPQHGQETCTKGGYRYDPTIRFPTSSPVPPPNPPPPVPPGESCGGCIFLILLAVFVVVYIVGGMGFNKYKNREESNVKNLFPHREFWSNFASLVGEGARFTVTSVKGLMPGQGGGEGGQSEGGGGGAPPTGSQWQQSQLNNPAMWKASFDDASPRPPISDDVEGAPVGQTTSVTLAQPTSYGT